MGRPKAGSDNSRAKSRRRFGFWVGGQEVVICICRIPTSISEMTKIGSAHSVYMRHTEHGSDCAGTLQRFPPLMMISSSMLTQITHSMYSRTPPVFDSAASRT